MVDSIKRWYSYFIIMYSGLLPTFANIHCPKPVLSENTQVVQLHSDVNLTCPGCHGQTWWSRHNQTRKLQDGSHLSLRSISYEDEDTYTCHRGGTPACTTQLLVKDDIEKPQISCYIRHPTHNITCDWQTTRELRPHAKVTLIAWMLKGNHKNNRCTYIPLAGKFTCSTLYEEGDTRRHILSLCIIGRTDSQTSNTVDSTSEMLVQPDPPINVTVTSLEHQPRKLQVSWSPPSTWLNYFYQLQYQVQYHVEGTQHVSNGTTFDEHFMISDALQRRRHVVRVRAKEEFMVTWSAWSEETVGTPWSAKVESEPLTTTGFIMTSAEEEEEEPEGEKSLSQQEEPSPPPAKERTWEISPSPTEDVEEGEVGDMGTPPGDLVVLESSNSATPEDVHKVCDMGTPPGTRSDYFTSDSAQRLICQIMAWNGEIDEMRNRLDRMQQEMKDMIDVLGRI